MLIYILCIKSPCLIYDHLSRVLLDFPDSGGKSSSDRLSRLDMEVRSYIGIGFLDFVITVYEPVGSFPYMSCRIGLLDCVWFV